MGVMSYLAASLALTSSSFGAYHSSTTAPKSKTPKTKAIKRRRAKNKQARKARKR